MEVLPSNGTKSSTSPVLTKGYTCVLTSFSSNQWFRFTFMDGRYNSKWPMRFGEISRQLEGNILYSQCNFWNLENIGKYKTDLPMARLNKELIPRTFVFIPFRYYYICNCLSMWFVLRCLTDWGENDLWWFVLSGKWLSPAGCWQYLLSMKRLIYTYLPPLDVSVHIVMDLLYIRFTH